MTATHSGAARIEGIFAELLASGGKALMPFVVGGHPSIELLPSLLTTLDESGASVIEVGIPFSDPIADGPVIASAMHDAIEHGVTPMKVLDAIARARPQLSCAIIAMVSVSIVHRLGTKQFMSQAKDAGVDGFIFPDAPLDEAANLSAQAAALELTSSLLVAPTTPQDRAKRIAEASTGFVYMLTRRGITGGSGQTSFDELAARISFMRSLTTLPIACGFGIATGADVHRVVHEAGADAAIVGAAVVKALTNASNPTDAARTLMTQLCAGLKHSQ